MSDDSSTAPPGYASDPTLEMLWGPPPAYTGNTGAAGTGSAAPAPDSQFISADLASLQATEQTMLSAETAIVAEYNQLLEQVQAAIASATIYGQQATYTETLPTGGGARHNGPTSVTEVHPDTPLQQSAQQFAEQINPTMTRVLRMLADTTETLGVYTALLDKAGQAYTAADKSSALPSAPPAPSVPPAA